MLRKNHKYKGQLSASHYGGCTSSKLKMAIDRMAGLLPDTLLSNLSTSGVVWTGKPILNLINFIRTHKNEITKKM